MRWRRSMACAAVSVALAACGSTPPTAAPRRSGGVTSPAASGQGMASGPAARGEGPPAVPGQSWHGVGTRVHGRWATYLATTRHATVALLWLDPMLLTFRYVPGYQFPEHGPVRAVDRDPSTWTPRLAAAFNGAFKLRDHVGGYYYAGRTVSPLRTGLASLVVDRRGRMSIVRWGVADAPAAGTEVVRQNLPLIVDDFRSQTSPQDTNRTWGYALHNAARTDRSALGVLADGSFVYVFAHSVTAPELAAALVAVHARLGMVLDMNPGGPGAFYYRHAGATLTGSRVLPSVVRTPRAYEAQSIKDFVVALTP